MTDRCDHCGRRAKLRRARFAPQLYCPRCWDRFGGRHKLQNREAARRRASGQ